MNEEQGSGSEDEAADDEEWGGVAGEPAATSAPGPSNNSHGKPIKPPTAEEMRAIREATDLYRSSSFKLQVMASFNRLVKEHEKLIRGTNTD